MLLLWSMLGCQEPFGADRRDLRGFRIAALTAQTDADTVRPTAAVIMNGNLWSPAGINLDWSFIEAPGDAGLEPEPEAQGFAPVLTRRSDRLALHAWTDELSAWAELDLRDRQVQEVLLQTDVVDIDIGDLPFEGYTREERRSWVSSPGTQVEPNGVLRVRATGSGLARFMATGRGTYLELESLEADWVAAELLFEDEEVTIEQIGSRTYSLLVSVIDGTQSGFAVQDIHVGSPTRGVMVNGRWIPSDQPLEGRLWVNLFPDDNATAGIRILDPMPAEPNTTWEPEGVGCVGVSGLFDPNWLLTGACHRGQVVGSRVLLEVD